MKTHFLHREDAVYTACCRPIAKARTARSTTEVTCIRCRNTEAFVKADARQTLLREQAFREQEPAPRHTITGTQVICSCGHDMFRERPRSLDFFNYVCAKCGKTTSPLTETGMCR